MAESDEELVARVRAQDSVAFDLLYARYRQRVHRHLLAVVRDPATADDLTQEAFLRLWTRAEQWEGRGALSAWLLRVATNLALNHLRTLRRRREQPLATESDPAGEEIAGGDLARCPWEDGMGYPAWVSEMVVQSPEAILERSEQTALVRRLIDGLPEEKREVLRLVHEQEMEVREVAEALGIPEGTVKSRLHYARQSLARAWEAIEDER